MNDWFYQVMGQDIGPVSPAELKAKVDNGQIQADTMVRKGTDGKWLFAGRVKGLIPVPDEPPPPPPPATRTPRPMDVAHDAKSARNRDESASNAGTESERSAARVTTMALVETESANSATNVSFYDFVGFREAITPALYDAVQRFVESHGITISQLNRRALAEFIRQPELASDLSIIAVCTLPQTVNQKSNSDGSQPLDAGERDELATFRFTLCNTSPHDIRIEQAEFVPEFVDVRDYDNVGSGDNRTIDHAGHVPVPFDHPQVGKAIRFALQEVIASQTKRDITLWFQSETKSTFTIAVGRLSMGTGNDHALSPSITIILHGDSAGRPK